MALSEACRRKEDGAERQPALTMAPSPSAGGAAAHEGAKSAPGGRRRAGKALSAVLFLSMWVVPPLIHRAGFRWGDVCPHPPARASAPARVKGACSLVRIQRACVRASERRMRGRCTRGRCARAYAPARKA